MGGEAWAQAASEVGGMWYDDYSTRRAMKYNAQEAQKQRDWAEMMSNTAYQRAAKDLEKAGLNRVLALGGPGSTPGGSSASTSQGQMRKIDLMNIATAQQGIKNMEAQKENIEADTRIKNAEAGKVEVTKMLYDKIGPKVEQLLDKLLSQGSALDARDKLDIDKKVKNFVMEEINKSGKALRNDLEKLKGGLQGFADDFTRWILNRKYGNPNQIGDK